MPVCFVLESEAVSCRDSVESGRVIDEDGAVIDLTFLAEFRKKRLGE